MRRLFRPRILIGIALGLILLYTLVGFLLIPYIITEKVVPAVAEQIKHPVVLREAAFNPFALSLRLKGLEIQEQNQTPMLGFDELFINLRVTTLFLQKVAFDEIHLVMPFVAARVDRAGKLNLLALVPPDDPTKPAPPPAAEPKPLMPVQIDLLEIGQGIVEYRDESKARPVAIDVVPFTIALRNFNTVPSQENENAHAFTAELGKGETIAWEGTIFLEPLESDGKVTVSGIKLKTLYQAVRDLFQFEIPQGVLGLSASYHFDLRGQAPQATVTNGKVSVRNLAVMERGALEPVMTIPVFDIEGIKLDLQKQTIDVARVHSADARFDAWLEPDGVLNFQPLFAPVSGGTTMTKSAPAKPEQAKPAKPWSISVNEVAVRNYGVEFEDRTLARPGHVDLSAMNLTVKDVQIPFKKPLPVDVSLRLNRTGSIGVQGKVAVEPFVADADLKLEHIEIQPFQPYLDRSLAADVRDGAIDVKGTVRFVKEPLNEPQLRFQGDLAVNDLAIADRKKLDDVLTWKALNVKKIDLSVEPTAVKIAEVIWNRPSIDLVVEPDGQLNLSHLTPSPPPGEPPKNQKEPEPEKPNAKASEPVPVRVDQVKLVKLAATYQDLSIDPTVKTSLTEFGGTIKGLSSKQLKKADVNLLGKVGRSAPLKVVGKINPLSEDAFTDLVITLGGMDLTSVGSYSGKYAGYGLSKGRLSLDLRYKISEKILEAENVVHVDQLTFGQKTSSPDATSLPVPLIVALLKDRKGLIEIDMPIRGDLKDPDFRYGKVVLSTLLNLLTKVVASPFSLMGKLVPGGGSEEDLQFIQFAAGSVVLPEGESNKLEALVTALSERDGLRLDIKGTYASTLDRAALQRAKLQDQLFEMKGIPRSTPKTEQEPLSPKEEQRFIEKLYAKLPLPESSSAESTQPTVEEMKQKVTAAIQISDAELDALANQRAAAIRDRLLESGKLTEDRIGLQDIAAAESGYEHVRTQLSLSPGVSEPTPPSE